MAARAAATNSSNRQAKKKKKAALKLEKDYKAALDGIPDKKYDPWGGVRPPGNPK